MYDLTLSQQLEQMNMTQLRRVMGRFAPGKRATARAQAQEFIRQALASPDALARVIMGLSPFELALLQELKRHKGWASGWAIYAEAVLRGLHPEPLTTKEPFDYRYRRGRPEAQSQLSKLVSDGLLLSGSLVDAWSPTRHSGMITADPSLLEHVPDHAPGPILTLPLEPAQTEGELSARHPAASVLEYLEVVRLTWQQGGLHVTKAGQFAKAFLNRLAKERPQLEERLVALLRTMTAQGLAKPPADDTVKQPWAIVQEELTRYRTLPLHYMYAHYLDTSILAGDAEVSHHWHVSVYDGADEKVLWELVKRSLPALPDHPVDARAAAEAIWGHVLVKLLGLRSEVWGNHPGPIKAIERLLSVVFPSLGLLAAGSWHDGDGEERTVIVRSEGSHWYQQARAVVEGRSQQTRADLEQAELALEQSGPALLVQPNFEVLVYLQQLTAGAVRALAGARLQRLDEQTATFLIDRDSVMHVLDSGITAPELLELLGQHSHSVPDNVARAITDWATRRERLQLHVGTRIIEYPSQSVRDAALTTIEGGRALEDRFVLLSHDAPEPAVASEFDYDFPLDSQLTSTGVTTIKLASNQDLNLAARGVLVRLATKANGNSYALDESKVRGGALSANLLNVLESQLARGIPKEMEVLLNAWSGGSKPPVVASAVLFQHPEASSWAKHPKISKLLGTRLSPSTYLVEQGNEAELKKQLELLGVGHTGNWPATRGKHAADQVETSLQTGLSTRKMREIIEAAIAADHLLELTYASETRRYDYRGYGRRNRGKTRTDLVNPLEIVYEGSTPYLDAVTVKRGTHKSIRVGYIEAIGVRVG